MSTNIFPKLSTIALHLLCRALNCMRLFDSKLCVLNSLSEVVLAKQNRQILSSHCRLLAGSTDLCVSVSLSTGSLFS